MYEPKIIPSIIYDDYLQFISNGYSKQIKYIRHALGLTQGQFGKLLGVHKKTVAKWEQGRSQPTRDNFQKLMEIKKDLQRSFFI